MSAPDSPAAMADVLDLLRTALEERPDEVREALTVRPCHVTGMHEPGHHVKYTCSIQMREVATALLDALGLADGLPRGLHGADCYWCHAVPTQEKYREDLRQTYRWAGVEIGEELAAPAPDVTP